ncbi:MAG: FAD-dependent 5-carboxymethylaminomethyl-2-thiouridine(34) oxidoreductase MnmC [Halofilum sp. (in: g-proteobacteria)]|nr:FAD-dependent 5-carboxymethylaminomethyl-2-thiouridine(34) oxidoreductase MnmC [Halofilum sp. (in: g-proteobacteria)]
MLVVGAGLAGSATAAALARDGWRVTLLSDPCATAASAIPLAVLAPYPTTPTDALTRLRARGTACTQALLTRLERQGLDAGRRARGVLLVPAGPRERRRHARVAGASAAVRRLDPARAEAACGVRPPEPAVLHAGGACIDPAALCRALLAGRACRVTSRHGRVVGLGRTAAGWAAFGAGGDVIASAPRVVLAAGPAVAELWPGLAGAITPVRGQASAFRASAASARLRVPVSHGGYVTPAVAGVHWAGATAQRGDADATARVADDAVNARRVASLWPHDTPAPAGERFVAVRASTPDRLPRVGALAPGLWVNAGHGAHGLMTAPLCAALLARALRTGRPVPGLAAD